MSVPKYKKFIGLMTEKNSDLFDEFQIIHDEFAQNGKREKEFHQLGRDVVDVMRDWERRLCSGMERGSNAVYSQKLAEKYWNEIEKRFSHIKMVGLKTRSTKRRSRSRLSSRKETVAPKI